MFVMIGESMLLVY